MSRLTDLAARLTPEQLREVEDFAEFLATRRSSSKSATSPAASEHKINFEGWAGCLAGVEPEKSDKQLVREAWDELLKKYE